MCMSEQDKATIFPIKLSGPVLVKSLPLLAVTDLTCFLPSSENGHNAAFIKHVRQIFSSGSLMQRCEGNASPTSSDLRLKPDLCPHQAILR